MNLKERLINNQPTKHGNSSINMDTSENNSKPHNSTLHKTIDIDTRSASELTKELEYVILKSNFDMLPDEYKVRFHKEAFEEMGSSSYFVKCFINAFGFVIDDALEKAGYGRRFDRLTDEQKERFFRLSATMPPYGDILRLAKDIDNKLFPSYNKGRNFKLRTILTRAQVFSSHYKYFYE